ncbi:hypothetical protein CRM22_002444 [Opisthorchis felineus]|uniref:Uncharacterized protein n=1 Tax=Opisthorchis felineus TaxID=147828 RepID=A0A4V3SGC9_OPIFE|nr:hypothetical protein CRM22_002444 [Opisthorchis felineus]
MHCTVSSLIKPGSSNHEVNITGCWRRVTLGLAVTQRTHLPPPSKWMESQQEEILETASSTHSESAEDAQEPDTDYQSDDLEVKHYTVCTVKMWKMPWGNFTKIDLKKCLLSIVDNPIPVQSISNDFQASAVFKQLFSDASAIYRSESDDRMLYRQQLADHIIRATETPNQIEFNLILSPTNCRKWDDVGHFLRDRQDQCKGVQSPQNWEL